VNQAFHLAGQEGVTSRNCTSYCGTGEAISDARTHSSHRTLLLFLFWLCVMSFYSNLLPFISEVSANFCE
jgi:hypothetical protein